MTLSILLMNFNPQPDMLQNLLNKMKTQLVSASITKEEFWLRIQPMFVTFGLYKKGDVERTPLRPRFCYIFAFTFWLIFDPLFEPSFLFRSIDILSLVLGQYRLVVSSLLALFDVSSCPLHALSFIELSLSINFGSEYILCRLNLRKQNSFYN